jgi:hypothetical protein
VSREAPAFTRGSLTFNLRAPRHACPGSPRVHAGEPHLRPTPPRAACGLEAPAFTRGSLTFTLRRPAPRAAWKPPRSRGGASPSPYAAPRHARPGSPRVYAGEPHLHPTPPRATRT